MMPESNIGRPRHFGLQPYRGVGHPGANAAFGAAHPRRAGAAEAHDPSSLLSGLLALGLLLSPSSQLRPSGIPIGPGEICLTIWLVLMLGREAMQRGPIVTPTLSRMLVFWALFAIALCIGTMTGFALHDRHDPVWFLHDVTAYPFLAAVSCLSVADTSAKSRLHRVAWFLALTGTASLGLQLANAWGLIGVPHADPWYWNRFRGWSENPEQLALLCAALALLSLHLAETASRPGARLTAIACAILPIYVGRLTRTDTFTIVLLIAGPMFAVLKLKAWLHTSDRKMPLRSAVAWIAVLALPLILAAAAPLVSGSAGRTAMLAETMLKDDGRVAAQETELRLHLWSQAWRRGVEAGMLGLGPGPHLNIPPSIVAGRVIEEQAPKNVLHPAANGMPNFEAHNTPLDLFTQGGLLAALSFLWLVGAALVSAYRAQLAGLTTMVGGLFLFGMAGSIVRQPIFWFAIALGLVASTGTRYVRRQVAILPKADQSPRFNDGIYPIPAGRLNSRSAGSNTNSGGGLA